MKTGKYPGTMTASAVKTLLDINDSDLKRLRDGGHLETFRPPGRKYHLYKTTSVNALLAASQADQLAFGIGPARVREAGPEDVPALEALIRDIFGTPKLDRFLWTERLRERREIGYVIEVNGELVACAFVFPLPRSFIDRVLLSEEVTPPIYTDLIGTYEPGGEPRHLYLYTWGITPRAARRKKRAYGMLLIRQFARQLVAWGERGVPIEGIWSRSRTPDGVRLLREAGFTRVRSTTSYQNFVINVETSGLPVIEDYRQAFGGGSSIHVPYGSC